MSRVQTATLALDGRLKVGDADLGAVLDLHDAQAEAALLLRAHGYVLVGEWTEDERYDLHAPVEYLGMEGSLGALRLAGDRLTRCEAATRAAKVARARTVSVALTAGVRGADIARLLGVSRARVYQIRDESKATS